MLVVTQADYSDWGLGRGGAVVLERTPWTRGSGGGGTHSTAQEEGRELTGSS